MRAHLTRIVAILLSALPAAGSAFEWSARGGLLYNRSDDWPAEGVHSYQPRLDIDLRLSLNGDVAGPGVVDYSGFVEYLRTANDIGGARKDLTNSLTYNVTGALFHNPSSPFALNGFAERADSRFESSLGQDVVGDRVTNRYGGALRLVGDATPDLEVGYTRFDYDEHFQTLPDRTRLSDSVFAKASHSIGAFGVGASYVGEWSDGTFGSDQYDSDQVSVTARADLGPGQFQLSDNYVRRTPTSTGPGAFDAFTNAFLAGVVFGTKPGEVATAQFSSQRARTSIDDTVSAETTGSSLRYWQDFRLDPEYFIRTTADLSRTEQSTSDGDLRSSGGTLAPELWWRRETTHTERLAPGAHRVDLIEVSGGPVVGLLSIEGDPAMLQASMSGESPGWRVGYGGVARTRVRLPWMGHQLGGMYEVRYGKDVYGTAGWSLDQQGSATFMGTARGGGFSAEAGLQARRSWNPVLRDNASRTASLGANYAFARYSVFARGSLSNGVLPGATGFIGDGFLVPVGFDTRSVSAVAGASATYASMLQLRADWRYTQTVFPGQPNLAATEANGLVSYRYGAFEVSAEDRLTWADEAGTRVFRNFLFVRVSRTIGSRY